MIYQSGELTVRKLQADDGELLAKWLSDPKVLEYYEGRDRAFGIKEVKRTFYNREHGVQRCIIEYEGTTIGYIQYYPLDEETRNVYRYSDDQRTIYGTDQFIGETDYWNRGIGSHIVQSMTEFLVQRLNADTVVMDPQAWNERAIRCYEKCGFKKAGFLPKHEFHEGEYRDCWLMEYNTDSNG